jgi:hypothetical protein
MSTQPNTQLIQWQDFKVRNEVDIVLEIAQQQGWEDCEIFGSGSMITQPQESMGWKLIPADLYEYSIPAEGVSRVHQVINAGVRVQGVIIADDERGTESPTPSEPEPTKLTVSLPSAESVLSFISKVLLVLIVAIGAIAFAIAAWRLLIVGAIVGVLGSIFNSTHREYDPKLVILVDDGNGGTVWVSVLTWYD